MSFLLGHGSLQTTLDHYVAAGRQEAVAALSAFGWDTEAVPDPVEPEEVLLDLGDETETDDD